MSKLLVRWTFGEWAKKRTSPQGISMLRVSIEFAKLIFPEADFLLCCNHLYWSKNEIEELVAETGVAFYDALPHLPDEFTAEKEKRNYFWKYVPSRLNPDGYELVLDNDVILWRRPAAIESWLQEGGLVATSDREKTKFYGDYYGDYKSEVNEADPFLSLNSGILGWPPGFVPSLDGINPGDFVYTEQGFSALLFTGYTGPKRLIPYSDIPLSQTITPRHNVMSSEVLIESACGAHFGQCTYGFLNHWSKYYQAPIEAYLHKRQVAGSVSVRNPGEGFQG